MLVEKLGELRKLELRRLESREKRRADQQHKTIEKLGDLRTSELRTLESGDNGLET